MSKKDSDNSQRIVLDIPLTTAIKVVGVVLLMLLAVQFLTKITTIILLGLAAILFAIALNPLVAKIRRKLRIKRRVLAISLAFGMIVTVLVTIFMVTALPVFNQISDFAEDLPERVEEFKDQDNIVADLINRHELDEAFSDMASNIADRFKSDIGGLVDILQKISSAFGGLLIVLFLTFMLLLEGPGFVDQIKHYLDEQQSRKWTRVKNEMTTVIRGYITGQLLIALIGGLFSLLLMIIIGVPNPLAMASIVAVFALVPLIGALIGAVVVVLLTGLVSVQLALIMLVWFVVYQQIENMTLQPWIQGQQTNLTALQVFVVAVIGGSVAGVVGVLLAVPIAACGKIVAMDYLMNHKDEIKRRYLRGGRSPESDG